MALEKKPFRKYNLEDRKDKGIVLSIWLNEVEMRDLENYKRILQEPKDSTAFKKLAEMGKILIDDNKIRVVIDTLFKNKARNRREGIIDFD